MIIKNKKSQNKLIKFKDICSGELFRTVNKEGGGLYFKAYINDNPKAISVINGVDDKSSECFWENVDCYLVNHILEIYE